MCLLHLILDDIKIHIDGPNDIVNLSDEIFETLFFKVFAKPLKPILKMTRISLQIVPMQHGRIPQKRLTIPESFYYPFYCCLTSRKKDIAPKHHLITVFWLNTVCPPVLIISVESYPPISIQ
jgi:hypothetical protein